MNLHFFIREEKSNSHCLIDCVLIEELDPKKEDAKYSLIEEIKFYRWVSTDSSSFQVKFGESAGFDYDSKNLKALKKEMKRYHPPSVVQVSKEEYIALRKKCFELYEKRKCLDISTAKEIIKLQSREIN